MAVRVELWNGCTANSGIASYPQRPALPGFTAAGDEATLTLHETMTKLCKRAVLISGGGGDRGV